MPPNDDDDDDERAAERKKAPEVDVDCPLRKKSTAEQVH